MAYTFDENTVSDLHKDAYGFRPEAAFWTIFNAASDNEKQYIWDCLIEALDFTMNSEANEKISAINAFEVEIVTALDLGARSRDEAVRWVVESMDLDDMDLMYGGELICFRKCLPYSMAPLFNNAINYLIKEVA